MAHEGRDRREHRFDRRRGAVRRDHDGDGGELDRDALELRGANDEELGPALSLERSHGCGVEVACRAGDAGALGATSFASSC